MKYQVRVTLEEGGTDFVELFATSPEDAKDNAMNMDGVADAVVVKVLPRAGGSYGSGGEESAQSVIDNLVG